MGDSLQALKSPTTAGTGAFVGVLSTPIVFVWLSITVTLICGCLLGLASAR